MHVDENIYETIHILQSVMKIPNKYLRFKVLIYLSYISYYHAYSFDNLMADNFTHVS